MDRIAGNSASRHDTVCLLLVCSAKRCTRSWSPGYVFQLRTYHFRHLRTRLCFDVWEKERHRMVDMVLFDDIRNIGSTSTPVVSKGVRHAIGSCRLISARVLTNTHTSRDRSQKGGQHSWLRTPYSSKEQTTTNFHLRASELAGSWTWESTLAKAYWTRKT